MDHSDIQTIEHDVLVVGAGGAGIRAAIECADKGLSTGIISKSLLGKAHTVMAEGGIAASLGNVDSRDNWKIHFRDTMRGGKFLKPVAYGRASCSDKHQKESGRARRMGRSI